MIVKTETENVKMKITESENRDLKIEKWRHENEYKKKTIQVKL